MRINLQGFIRRSGRTQAWVKHWQTGIYIYIYTGAGHIIRISSKS